MPVSDGGLCARFSMRRSISRKMLPIVALRAAYGAETSRASIDTQIGRKSGYATSVVRLVWRRDGGRCRAPGCRSTRELEIHHVVHRADGGTHDVMNLILSCSSCHLAHHRGVLTITGTADEIVVHRRAETQAARVTGARAGAPVNAGADVPAIPVTGARVRAPVNTDADVPAIPVGGARVSAPVHGHADVPGIPVTGAHMGARRHADEASKLDVAIVRTQAKAALIGLGWKPAMAATAVRAAAADLGAGGTLEQWIRAALRWCPRPLA